MGDEDVTMTEEELEFTRAPRANLQTWEGLKKTIVLGSVGVIIVLAGMAMFLTD